jgi:uncharacterized protein (DUF58 family)
MLAQELMRKVRALEIRTRRSVSEVFAGEYSSAFRGRGMEFSEVRAYQPGDDVRSIDWNVTARMGGPYVKRFVEERELTIVLAVDLSGSGRFGSVLRSKNETAAELCAVLAFAATQKNDKVGLVIFTDTVELVIPPRKGLKHALRLIRELLNFEPQRRNGHRIGTDIAQAARTLDQMLKRRAVIFMVSDFLTGPAPVDARSPLPENVETAMRLLARRHDVIAGVVADPRERDLVPAGLIELEDAESGRRMILDTGSAGVRARFHALARRRTERVREQLRRTGIDSFEATTRDESYIQSLVELFRRRERRR